ncbi:MAG TPA: serine/threonine-protein kinase [Gemmataceae bacterium]|nr:serine/threonine-protein kinase [Gemmataceae bacterium]
MIGSRLGRWVLDRVLGRGGMGCVYLAHDADDPDRLAAVKVLAAELTCHAGAVYRFQREIEVLGTLDHPNVVHFLESGTHEGQFYYVMEYVEGRDYAELLEESGRLPWPEVLDLAVQVCAALRHAHDHGVIHRDVKPSNLMRGADGRVRLTDFGIAHAFAAPHLTRPGSVVGTAEYVSPEQAEGKPATRRSDLYSLGCVLYTLLCGRNPFRGENVLDLLHKHRYGLFDPPRAVVPDLPPEIDDVVCQLMEKDPEKRPPDAGVLQRRLLILKQKLENRRDRTVAAVVSEPTQPGDPWGSPDGRGPRVGEGPATLMSRLMRKELEAQNRGGRVRQFLNRPPVLVALFVFCAGALAWTFWSADPEKRYREARPLLESDDPDDWAAGWERIKGVREQLANGPHADEVAGYEQKIAEYREARAASRRSDHLGEAQWFYQEGLRLRQQGHPDEARQTWRRLVEAFGGVPAERSWVRLAEKELAKQEGPTDDHRWDAARQALARARRLRAEGKGQEADEVCAALEELYRDDPSAKEFLDEVRRK